MDGNLLWARQNRLVLLEQCGRRNEAIAIFVEQFKQTVASATFAAEGGDDNAGIED
jgi:hypothetical protein